MIWMGKSIRHKWVNTNVLLRKQTAHFLKQALCVEKKMFVISITNAFYIILVNIGVKIISCLSFPQILISN